MYMIIFKFIIQIAYVLGKLKIWRTRRGLYLMPEFHSFKPFNNSEPFPCTINI